MRILFLVFLSLAVPWAGAAAQGLYVTDQLEITLRSGPGLDFKILEMLRSGTAVQRLEEKEGWSKVRTGAGHEGWVVTRYLSPEPPKGPRLAAAEEEVARLKGEGGRLAEALRTAQTAGDRSAEEAKRLRGRLEAVEKEFARWKEVNREVIALKDNAEQLAREQESARAELDRLRAENRTLQAREKFYWFFSGVVVLLLGWVLGYVYAASRHRAKSQARFRY